MSDHAAAREIPLLEIEITQLSNLFGGDASQQWIGIEESTLATEISNEKLSMINELDIYFLSADKRRELFVNAAFMAFMGRQPTSKELSDYLKKLKSSNNFNSVIKKLIKLRDENILRHNNSRDQIIRQTIDSIDRWNGEKLAR